MISSWIKSRVSILFALLILGIVVIFLLSIFDISSQEGAALGIAAVSAFFAAISSIATLLQAIEIQRQRENLERPYILCYFDSQSNGMIYFVIENRGNVPAKELTIKFDPSPLNFKNISLNELSVFANPISFLPPDKVIRQAIDSSADFLARNNLRIQISSSYHSTQGKTFEEVQDVDLTYFNDLTVRS